MFFSKSDSNKTHIYALSQMCSYPMLSRYNNNNNNNTPTQNDFPYNILSGEFRKYIFLGSNKLPIEYYYAVYVAAGAYTKFKYIKYIICISK